MPLLVEDGTGVVSAESLASVAFADTYHADRGNVMWATFDLAKKEQLLRRATDYIKYKYGPYFAGSIAFIGQGLPFPRVVNYINIGVPLEVQEATAELALVSNTTPLLPNSNTAKKRSVKVGPISVEYDAGSLAKPMFLAATTRLAPFIGSARGNGMTARLVRT